MKKVFKFVVPVIAAAVITISIFLLIFGKNSGSHKFGRSSDLLDSKSKSSLYVPDKKALAYDEASDIVYVNNIVLLFFELGTSQKEIDEVIDSVDGKVVGSIPFIDQYQVKIKPHSLEELHQICSDLKENQCVLDAVCDHAFAVSTDKIPDDPWTEGEEWSEQTPDGNNWWLEAIDAPTAWNHNDNLKNIKIGIVDSGFKTNHEDLKNVIKWTSKNNKSDLHGTHVAGIIGAEANNRRGITGVMWKSELYAFDYNLSFVQKSVAKISGEEWSTYNTMLGAVSYLISEQKAKVINFSLGYSKYMTGTTETEEEVNTEGHNASLYLYALLDRGYDFVIVQSAGNGNVKRVSVDARYNHWFSSIEAANCVTGPGVSAEDIIGRVIIVGSAERDDNGRYIQAVTSNAGSRVDICAPGVDIYSTVPTRKKYDTESGTSMAAPIVTGVAAMVWSINPSLTGLEVKQIVCDRKNTRYSVADNTDPRHPLRNTYRMVNANQALKSALKYKIDTSGLCTLASGLDSGVAAVMKDGSVRFEALNPNIGVSYKEIGSWKKIISIAYGYNYIVGLTEDGTVKADISARGLETDYGQCSIKDWKDIQQIAAGLNHTVGLKSNGTVVATGNNDYGQCDVDSWTNIVMIAAGDYHTVGLRSNGTVVATGRHSGYTSHASEVEDWRNIKQITAGSDFTAGLCTDGKVKVTFNNYWFRDMYGDTEEWDRVTLLAAGGSSSHLLALREDGSVVGIGELNHGLGGEFISAGKWKNMALLACSRGISVGVRKDGTVLVVGMEGDKMLNNFKGVRLNEQQKNQTE